MIFWILPYFCCTLVMATSLDSVPDNALFEALRQSPSSEVQLYNISSELYQRLMANVSSLPSNMSENETHEYWLRIHDRQKESRKYYLKIQLNQTLLGNRSMPSFSQDDIMMTRYLKQNSTLSSDIDPRAVQKFISFYPSCSLPINTDRSSWERSGTFRILHDINFDKYSSPNLNIITSKLRLYKKIGDIRRNSVLKINIYQFVVALRRNQRVRKRLIDSKNISADYEGWVEFNVKSAINLWILRSDRNFGLDVEVVDAAGNKLNPNLYLENMDCSSETPVYAPLPNIRDIYQEMGLNMSLLFVQAEKYPTMDLRTAEVIPDIQTADAIRERVVLKRSVQQVTENTCEDNIQFHYITFAEIGMDKKIFWPKGVQWAFCGGMCNSKTDCVVTKKESLPLILLNQEGHMYADVLEDFVPTKCGCRAS